MRKWVFLFFLLAGAFCAGRCVFADASRTVTLSVSVTNPSADQTREMDFRTELPPELKRNDILSADGLDVVYDSEAKVFAVQGKVNLRPRETIYYRILVRDVWLISTGDFEMLETRAKSLRSSRESDAILHLLNKIRSRQKQGYDELLDHIAAYRENRKELESIRRELLTEPSSAPQGESVHRTWFVIAGLVLGVAAAIGALVFLLNRRTSIKQPPGDFLRLSNDVKVDCILLPQGDVAPSPDRSIPTERGISVVLEERYREHAALEMKIFLPGTGAPLAFAGFVVEQYPVIQGGKTRYETFVCLVEAGENGYEILKQHIQTRLKD